MRGRANQALALAVTLALAPAKVGAESPYAAWTNGPPTDPNFFEIGVWYQTPTTTRINGYKAMGVNTFVYLSSSTTQAQLDSLTTAGMYTVMPQSALGLSNVNNKTIIAWFNTTDEPDNAQPNGSGGYTDPISPAAMISAYNTIKANDATRPAELNLGQGVAWDAWVGRGARTNHPEDYPASTTFTWTNGTTYHQGYLAGTDIGAFDFYPTNATNTQIAGNLSLVGNGVQRLTNWSSAGHPVWNYIETTNINNTDNSPGPTPAQVKAEVWLSITHGSMGIIYFAHTITPFSEPALLNDPTMNPAVTAINQQIKSLAPVLNTSTLARGSLVTGAANVSLAFMTKNYSTDTYFFTVADQSTSGSALFWDPAKSGVNATVEVLGETRTLSMVNGQFSDNFDASGVHLYRIIGVSGFQPGSNAWNWTQIGQASATWTTAANWDLYGVPDPGLAGKWINFTVPLMQNTTIAMPGTPIVIGNVKIGGGSRSYTLTGGTINFDGGPPGTPATLTQITYSAANTISGAITLTSPLNVANTSPNTLTLSGAISGGGSSPLTFLGPGTLALSSTSNSYSGGTTLQSGTLRVPGDGALGAANGSLTFNGGTLALTGALSGARPITVTPNGGTISAAGNTVSFTGANGYNWGGTLSLINTSGGSFTITRDAGGGGTVAVNAAAMISVALGSTLTINGSADPLSSGSAGANISNLGTVTFGGTGAKRIGNLDGASAATSTQLVASGTTTVSAGTSLTVNRFRQSSMTLISNSVLTINASNPLTPFPVGDDSAVSVVKTLIVPSQGTLNLTDNDLIIDYTGGSSPLAAIEALVRTGYNSGAWTGKGITSSTAAANVGSYALVVLDNAQRPSPFNTFDGISVPTTVVIVKFSWVADLDLDGIVTSNDAIVFANNYSEGAVSTHRVGDLNYNGVFDSNDAILFANAYSESLPHLPEPSTPAMIVIGGGSLLLRRPRR